MLIDFYYHFVYEKYVNIMKNIKTIKYIEKSINN
jgi:hypothetical protein